MPTSRSLADLLMEKLEQDFVSRVRPPPSLPGPRAVCFWVFELQF